MSVTRLEEKSVEPPTMVDVKIQNPDGDFDEKHAIHAMKSICKRDRIRIRRIYMHVTHQSLNEASNLDF